MYYNKDKHHNHLVNLTVNLLHAPYRQKCEGKITVGQKLMLVFETAFITIMTTSGLTHWKHGCNCWPIIRAWLLTFWSCIYGDRDIMLNKKTPPEHIYYFVVDCSQIKWGCFLSLLHGLEVGGWAVGWLGGWGAVIHFC